MPKVVYFGAVKDRLGDELVRVTVTTHHYVVIKSAPPGALRCFLTATEGRKLANLILEACAAAAKRSPHDPIATAALAAVDQHEAGSSPSH
jgi:hypothetical protein